MIKHLKYKANLIVDNPITYGVLEFAKITIRNYSFAYLIYYFSIFLIYIVFNLILWTKCIAKKGFDSSFYLIRILIILAILFTSQILFNWLQSFTKSWQNNFYKSILLKCHNKIANSSLEIISLDNFKDIASNLTKIEIMKIEFISNTICFLSFLFFSLIFFDFSWILQVSLLMIKIVFILITLKHVRSFLNSQELYFKELTIEIYKDILDKNETIVYFNNIILYFIAFFCFWYFARQNVY